MIIFRACKAALVASVSLFFLIVALDNMTDYGSNFAFVRHVLSMDDTFKGNREMWRALPYPTVHHIFYLSIIAWETVCGLATAYAAFRLAAACRGSAAEFGQARVVAVAALTACLLLWSVAFLTIGGEWFLMWQSSAWNGQMAAFRMFGIDGLILIFLGQSEESLNPAVHR